MSNRFHYGDNRDAPHHRVADASLYLIHLA